jgi:hypothetical protein
MYTHFLNNFKVAQLTDAQFRTWMKILAVSALHDGVIPDTKQAAFESQIPLRLLESHLAHFVAAGLIDRDETTGSLKPHDWDEHQYVTDRGSAQRMKRHRERHEGVTCDVTGASPVTSQQRHNSVTCDVTVTPSDTDTDTKTSHVTSQNQKQTQKQTQTQTSRARDFALSDIAERIWQRHPKHRRSTRQEAERALAMLLGDATEPDEMAEQINRRHEGWCRSEAWRSENQRFVPSLTRWLNPRTDGCNCVTEPPEEAPAGATETVVDDLARVESLLARRPS